MIRVSERPQCRMLRQSTYLLPVFVRVIDFKFIAPVHEHGSGLELGWRLNSIDRRRQMLSVLEFRISWFLPPFFVEVYVH